MKSIYDLARHVQRLFDQLEREMRSIRASHMMACQDPDPDCICPGCMTADRVHEIREEIEERYRW
jgi:hypothetical protein